jgi:hypothetical protein
MKIMKYITLTLLAPLIVFAQAKAVPEEHELVRVWKSESPDGNYYGALRLMPAIADRGEFDGFRLEIFPIEEVKWTADSKFLVFTTESSGGHSPWHSTTYVFSVSDKKIVCLDDVIGPVVDSDFKLEGAHTGTFKIDKKFPAGEHPEPIKLDISRLFLEDPKK